MKTGSNLVKVISVLLLVVAVLTPAASASAALRICRTDPLVYFSDGHKLSLTVSVAALPDEVEHILYIVHAPAGSQVTRIIHTAGGLGFKESVIVLDDEEDGVYSVDTVVQTRSQGVEVTASTMLMVGVTSTASGYAFDHLITTVVDPGNSPRK